MRKINFFGWIVPIIAVSVILFSCTGEARTGSAEMAGTPNVQTPHSPSAQSAETSNQIEILFGALWPFEEGTIHFKISEDRKTLTLSGERSDTFGVVCLERQIRLKGKRTLEIEVLDLGNSAFYNDKMLKVIINNTPKGKEIPLICQNDMAQSDDPEFIVPLKGVFRYNLAAVNDDAVYKLAFVFYNAKLDNLELKARFVD